MTTISPNNIKLGDLHDVGNCAKWKSPDISLSPKSPIPIAIDGSPVPPLPRRIPLASFPDAPIDGSRSPPTTIENIDYLVAYYGITVKYDVIKKRLYIGVPNQKGITENADSNAFSHVLSLVNLNGLSSGPVQCFLEVIGDRNLYNPVADWIKGKPWDGTDRFSMLSDTLVVQDGYPSYMKLILLKRWLISAVAAALEPAGFRTRGILTLQGPQSIGKTAWIRALVSDPWLCDQVVKIDHHLDPGNKDTILTAVAHWIVELGELESTLKRDLPKIKSFITSTYDKIRKPYGRIDIDLPRRTVFCATVNEDDFLIDPTGNTRFWTISVKSINHKHGIDMQQVFAQAATLYEQKEQWWLQDDEEQILEMMINKNHKKHCFIRDSLLEILVTDASEEKIAMGTTQLLREIKIDRPTNQQSKECAAVLRELYGEPKKIQGTLKWYVSRKKSDNQLF